MFGPAAELHTFPWSDPRPMAVIDAVIAVDKEGCFAGVYDNTVKLEDRRTWKNAEDPRLIPVRKWNLYFTEEKWLGP